MRVQRGGVVEVVEEGGREIGVESGVHLGGVWEGHDRHLGINGSIEEYGSAWSLKCACYGSVRIWCACYCEELLEQIVAVVMSADLTCRPIW